jgi:hypothetical protein
LEEDIKALRDLIGETVSKYNLQYLTGFSFEDGNGVIYLQEKGGKIVDIDYFKRLKEGE